MSNASSADDGLEEAPWEPRTPSVPSTWVLVDFEDAFEAISVNQKKVPAKSYKAEGVLPVIDQGQSFVGGYTDDETLAIDPGDGVIVFGDHTRIFKRIGFPFAAGADGIKVLRPRLTDSKYAFYACMSLQFPNRGYSRHYSFLARCKLPVAPEKEQARIVSKIDELFSRIDEGEHALEWVQKLVERYRQSVLKAAVTGELTRDWREKNKDKLESGEALLARILKTRREAWEKAELDKMRAKGITPTNDKWKQKYQEPVAPDTTDLPELPQGWAWASIDQLSLNHDGKRIPLKAADRDKRPGPYPYYGSQGVIDDIDDFLFDGNFLLVAEDGENLRSRIKPLAFNASGKFWVNNHAHILSPVPLVHRDFLRAAINSKNITRSVTGTAQPKLTQAALCKLAVPIASPLEQEAIVALLDAATSNSDAAMVPVASEVRRASGLRQSVLKSAFAGLLVAQDASDEPASNLLKRITIESSQAPANPKRGRKPKNKEPV